MDDRAGALGRPLGKVRPCFYCYNFFIFLYPYLIAAVFPAQNASFQVCYVIDPGMFTTPVTLSTWLQAQKNTTCNPHANVTS